MYYDAILLKAIENYQRAAVGSVITNNCKTCTPCESCKPAKIVCEEGITPCDICDPCRRSEICSYCGNGFCRCDTLIDTYDGPMHRDCAAKDGTDGHYH